MTVAPTADTAAPLLSGVLRDATRAAHTTAETQGFIERLMKGELTVAAYVDLLAQHHVIYAALESADDVLRQDPLGATLVVDGLARSAAIAADLEAFLGSGWRDEVRVMPATEVYAERLRAVVSSWVGGYAAHAYTRYLGDLSGGLAIKAILQRSYGIPAEQLGFYTFPAIPKPKLFKDEYRARLDALPLGEDERARVAEEAVRAFELNTAVFRDLGALHPA